MEDALHSIIMLLLLQSKVQLTPGGSAVTFGHSRTAKPGSK